LSLLGLPHTAIEERCECGYNVVTRSQVAAGQAAIVASGTAGFMDDRTETLLILLSVAVAILSSIATAVAAFTGAYGFNLFNAVDSLLFLALAVGLYRRSRICAVALLVYHLFNRVDILQRTHDAAFAFSFFAITYGVVYALGVWAAFSYHGRPRADPTHHPLRMKAGDRWNIGFRVARVAIGAGIILANLQGNTGVVLGFYPLDTAES
jgi:hypothetical protein